MHLFRYLERVFKKKKSQEVRNNFNVCRGHELENIKSMNETIRKKLEVYNSLSDKYPDLVICGSLALFLDNLIHEDYITDSSDLDVISDRYLYIEEAFGKEEVINKSGNDVEYSFDYSDVKVDYFFSPNVKWKIVEFEENFYKIQLSEQVVLEKVKFFMRNPSTIKYRQIDNLMSNIVTKHRHSKSNSKSKGAKVYEEARNDEENANDVSLF